MKKRGLFNKKAVAVVGLGVCLAAVNVVSAFACEDTNNNVSGDVVKVSSNDLKAGDKDVDFGANYSYVDLYDDLLIGNFKGKCGFDFKRIKVLGEKASVDTSEVEKCLMDTFGIGEIAINGTKMDVNMVVGKEFTLDGAKKQIKSITAIMESRDVNDNSSHELKLTKSMQGEKCDIYSYSFDATKFSSRSVYYLEICDANGANSQNVQVVFSVDSKSIELAENSNITANDYFKGIMAKYPNMIADFCFNDELIEDIESDTQKASNSNVANKDKKSNDTKNIDKKKADNKNTDNKNTDNKKTDNKNTNEKATNISKKDNTPKTGDSMTTGVTIAIIAGGLSLVSIMGAYILKKKRSI